MNKTDVIISVPEVSNVEINNCEKVIDTLEQVLSNKLPSSAGAVNAFYKNHID